MIKPLFVVVVVFVPEEPSAAHTVHDHLALFVLEVDERPRDEDTAVAVRHQRNLGGGRRREGKESAGERRSWPSLSAPGRHAVTPCCPPGWARERSGCTAYLPYREDGIVQRPVEYALHLRDAGKLPALRRSGTNQLPITLRYSIELCHEIAVGANIRVSEGVQDGHVVAAP
jgi:hypothetical protein